MTVRDLVGRCALVGSPPMLSEADYVQAAAELEGALAEMPGVVSVYATGSVSSPGISDLDRIAVADSPTTADVWTRMSPRVRTVTMHTPFLVDRASFGRHRWFARLEPLRLVSGEAIDVEEPGEHDLLDRLLAVEGLVLALLAVQRQLGTGRIKVRSTLCMLHSLRHSLELGGISDRDAAGAWRLVEDVGALRDAWFSLGRREREERLRGSMAAAVGALPEAISRLGAPGGIGDAQPPAALRLAAPWTMCTLVRSSSSSTTVLPPRPMRRPLNRSRRLGEALWRMRRFELGLAAPAFDLLALECNPDAAESLRKRQATVRSYREYLKVSAGQWSAIGFAQSFAGG